MIDHGVLTVGAFLRDICILSWRLSGDGTEGV